VAAGSFANVLDACQAAIRLTGRTAPGSARTAYPGYYERYHALYPALAPEFQAIAEVEARQLAAEPA
jgi:hypothetical protein